MALAAAVRDTFADEKRRRIPLEEVVVLCQQIAHIVATNFKPELVVAIGSGGTMPGTIIANALGVPVTHLTIRRKIPIRPYSDVAAPIRWLTKLYHHLLFNLAKPIIISNIEVDVRNKRVLVVDDAIHFGATIDIALKYLEALNVLEVKVATLSHVLTRKPEFSVLPRGNYCFPWSNDFERFDKRPNSASIN